MGKRGPAKQPQQLLDLKGYSTPSRERAEAIVGEKLTSLDQVDAIFDYSRLTPRGQRIFLQRCVFLIGLHLLEASYLDALLIYCQNYDMALKCMARINKEGWYIKTYDKQGRHSGYAEHPSLRIFDKICKTLNSYGTQFGFTPASRMRLQTESENEKKRDIMDITEDAIEV